jgi:hypothetical protein
MLFVLHLQDGIPRKLVGPFDYAQAIDTLASMVPKEYIVQATKDEKLQIQNVVPMGWFIVSSED